MADYNDRETIRKKGFILNFQTKKLQEIKDNKMVKMNIYIKMPIDIELFFR